MSSILPDALKEHKIVAIGNYLNKWDVHKTKNKQGRENYKENIGTELITNTKKQKLKI